jgi:hypothetical protein
MRRTWRSFVIEKEKTQAFGVKRGENWIFLMPLISLSRKTGKLEDQHEGTAD